VSASPLESRQWLTVYEFAALMNHSPQTVWGWVRDGTIFDMSLPIRMIGRGSSTRNGIFIGVDPHTLEKLRS
jgi:hypothetical protein